jgi:hypothetical protein
LYLKAGEFRYSNGETIMANPQAPLGSALELLCWYDGKSYSSGSTITQIDKKNYVCTNKMITMSEGANAPNAMVGVWIPK